MITVYHNKEFMKYALDNYTTEQKDRVLKDAVITKVAEVNTDRLDEAYRLTNNIDSDWTKNTSVKVIGSSQQRSTSVGDVLQNSDGYHTVETFGFRKLSDEEVSQITLTI